MKGAVSSCRHLPSTMNLYWWYLLQWGGWLGGCSVPLGWGSGHGSRAQGQEPHHRAPKSLLASRPPDDPAPSPAPASPGRQVHDHREHAGVALHQRHWHGLHPSRERAAEVDLRVLGACPR